MRRYVFVVSLLCPLCLAAQDGGRAAPFALTVENIMRGPELVGVSPSNVRFTPDGAWLLFRWRQGGVDTAVYDYRVSVTGGRPERLARGVVDTIPTAEGSWSPDGRQLALTLDGDLVLVDRQNRGTRLTDTRDRESNPHWSGDGRTLFFARGGNLYGLELSTARLTQLTDLRRGEAPKADAELTGQRKFLTDQQAELFDHIRRAVAERKAAADSDTAAPKPFYYGEREGISDLRASPDGRWVAFTVSQRPGDTRQTTMPRWVTESGYTETEQIRVKVGDQESRSRAALLEVPTGSVAWIRAGLNADSVDFEVVDFNPQSNFLLVRGTSLDYTRRALITVALESSRAERIVDDLKDEAWIGPFSNPAGWLDGSRVWFQSERTGTSHLYVVPAAGGAATPWTSGPWEVQSTTLSPDRQTFYLRTNEGDLHQQHSWTIAVARGPGSRTQLTTAEGRQDVVVSPDGRTLAALHSAANQPPDLFAQEARAGARTTRLTVTASDEFRSFTWTKAEIVQIPARDGARVPVRIYRPQGGPNGAGVIFVHGAGYLQNVHRWWSANYFREYMFHHLLAARGYTVLDIDYRGSQGYGRDWRTAIYRHMGGKDLTDQVDGARWMVQNLGVDSARIGIYGGSYGGFITLMAMFTTPGVFKAGAALRPVTDWAHYNHPYTARILNEPQDDAEAYRRSSPIYFAEGLQGHLLIAHGMVDDNVHFQDAVRLVQRLIELKKENWEMAAYPVEPHGFQRATSWMDEYKRILKLFETALR